MAPSNTMGVFREAVGRRIVGMYSEPSEFAGTVVVLVLDDGTGLAFGTGNGSHWNVSKSDVGMHVSQRRRELKQLERDLLDVMALEGASRDEGEKP